MELVLVAGLGASKVDHCRQRGRRREVRVALHLRVDHIARPTRNTTRRRALATFKRCFWCQRRVVFVRKSHRLRVCRKRMHGTTRERRGCFGQSALLFVLRRLASKCIGRGVAERQHARACVVQLMVDDGPEALLFGCTLGMQLIVRFDHVRFECRCTGKV